MSKWIRGYSIASSGSGLEGVRALRTPLHFALLAMMVIFAGCVKLHRESAQFAPGRGCAHETDQAPIVNASDIGAQSETGTLQCVLSALRGADKTTAQSSLLGSRVCLLLATRVTDPAEREKLSAEGVRFAEKAIATAEGDDGAAHYYLASNLGLVVRNHVVLAMENIPRLEHEMKRALVLSPEIDDGGPLRLLGMLYLKAPPWPAGIGDGDKALDLLGNAVKNHPRHPLNHLFYGQALWEVDAAGERARGELAIGLKKLNDNHWGYNRVPWMQEFAAVQREFDGSGQ